MAAAQYRIQDCKCLEGESLKAVIGSGIEYNIAVHVNPDCDAFFSAVALRGLIIALGGRAHIIQADGFPAKYLALIPDGALIQVADCDADLPLIIVDCQGIWRTHRLVKEKYKGKRPALVIDHHPHMEAPEGALDARVIVRCHHDAAAGQTIARLAEADGIPVDAVVGKAVLIAIYSDSQMLTTKQVTAETMRLVDWLDPKGAVREEFGIIREQRAPGTEDACDEFSANLKREGNFVWSNVGCGKLGWRVGRPDDDWWPSHMKDLGPCVAFGLFQYEEGGKVRVSLRAVESDIDLKAIVEKFPPADQDVPGGGHEAACGITIVADKVEELRGRVLAQTG